jgi:NhaA family Na+:H+ antiporter
MRITKMMKSFIKMESSSGIIMLIFAISAIIITNSKFIDIYQNILNFKIPLDITFFGIYKDLSTKDWINDALMAIFFLFVGLELKREVLIGELSSKSKILLPALSALGGIIFPALIYLHFNNSNELYIKGWAIPTATDIAFAVAVLNLFGNRVNSSLRVFLVALAVIDDLAAILIIALFYSADINIYYIDLALIVMCLLFILNRLKITNLFYYIFLGILLWVFILKSGIHATVAGVILAFFIPIIIVDKNKSKSPLHILENRLHNFVTYLILPIFAFANSGISFASISFNTLFNNLVMGIAAGLFIGKQVGVFSIVYILHKLKICNLFKNCNWLEVYGVCILTGIGFTMSLFIGNLAFTSSPQINNEIILGVIIASILSAVIGALFIFLGIKLKLKVNKQSNV